MDKTRSIEEYLDSINSSIESIRNTKQDISEIEVPSDFKIQMMGVKNSKALDFIFDMKLDKTIDNFMNKFMSGDFADIEKGMVTIKKVFELMGLGQGAFEGPVSKTLMQNMMNSMNTIKFAKTKNMLGKCLVIVKNLKKQAKDIDNPKIREKYKEAIRALKELLRFISKIYLNRKILSKRVITGLKMVVQESAENPNYEDGYEDEVIQGWDD